MVSREDLKGWLARGKHRRAIAASLNGVMTGAQLCQAAMKLAPKITARDIRAILRRLEEHGLARCLNPTAPCGRLFEATDEGRAVFASLGPQEPPNLPRLPVGIEASVLSYLLRAPVRRAVFYIVAKDDVIEQSPKSASMIKRSLRDSCPLTLNQTSRALLELRRAGLIVPTRAGGRLQAYTATPLGERLAVVLGYKSPVQYQRHVRKSNRV